MRERTTCDRLLTRSLEASIPLGPPFHFTRDGWTLEGIVFSEIEWLLSTIIVIMGTYRDKNGIRIVLEEHIRGDKYFSTQQRKETLMVNDSNGTQLQQSPDGVYGVEGMINTTGNMPIHSSTSEIEDGGELCDSDCVDCD